MTGRSGRNDLVDAFKVAIIVTTVVVVALKLATGLALAPLAVIALIVGLVGFAFDLRLRRIPRRRQ